MPALPAVQSEHTGGLFEVGGNGHGSGDHVEQDVPLRAKEKQNDGADAESSAESNKDEEDDRKQRRSRDRGGDLRQRLRNARQARVEADGDTSGDGPECTQQERGIDAKKGCAETKTDLMKFGAVQAREDQYDTDESVADSCKSGHADDAPEPQCRWALRVRLHAGFILMGKKMNELFAQGTDGTLANVRDAARTAEKIEYPGSWGAGALDLFKLEFLRPRDNGPP